MSVLRVAFLALLALGGCVSERPPEIAWSHDDYSSEAFAEDSSGCRDEVLAAVDVRTRTYAEVQLKKRLAQELYEYCLASLGYYLTEIPQRTKPTGPAGDVIEIRFEGGGPSGQPGPTLSRTAGDGPLRRFDLRIDGAPGVAFTAACTLDGRNGEEIVTLDGTVPQEQELFGRALSCRLLRQSGSASGALTVEVLRDGSPVARSTSTSGQASVHISVR